MSTDRERMQTTTDFGWRAHPLFSECFCDGLIFMISWTIRAPSHLNLTLPFSAASQLSRSSENLISSGRLLFSVLPNKDRPRTLASCHDTASHPSIGYPDGRCLSFCSTPTFSHSPMRAQLALSHAVRLSSSICLLRCAIDWIPYPCQLISGISSTALLRLSVS